MNKANPEIYFHVGLGKVASTYLQYRFFPKLKGIRYIQRTSYWNSPEIIQREKAEKYLISREFDRQLPDEVKWFSDYFPEAQPIILLRRHDQWIASQYRRYVKNGGPLSLEEFIDLDADKGPWKLKDLYFMPHIRTLEKCFACKPLVLFYQDFKADPWKFFDTLAEFMDVSYDREEIDLSPFHASYTEKQLKFMRKWGSRWFNQNRKLPGNPVMKWLKRRSEMLFSYAILYASLLAPEKWVEEETLYPPDYLERIRAYFEEDWQECVKYQKEILDLKPGC